MRYHRWVGSTGAIGFFAEAKELAHAFLHYDPAAKSLWEIVLLYPGYKAVLFHRLSHYFYRKKCYFIASAISTKSRFLTGIDIHPGAKLGRRLVIDHGMGVVIGETAEIGNDCIIYHGVTLGGTSLAKVKRHPTLKDFVVVGSGAKILGAITIQEHVHVGSNAVIVKDVPAHSTVVGIPGRVVATPHQKVEELDHSKLPDPLVEILSRFEARIKDLEQKR